MYACVFEFQVTIAQHLFFSSFSCKSTGEEVIYSGFIADIQPHVGAIRDSVCVCFTGYDYYTQTRVRCKFLHMFT